MCFIVSKSRIIVWVSPAIAIPKTNFVESALVGLPHAQTNRGNRAILRALSRLARILIESTSAAPL
jgi:hypothetical protein